MARTHLWRPGRPQVSQALLLNALGNLCDAQPIWASLSQDLHTTSAYNDLYSPQIRSAPRAFDESLVYTTVHLLSWQAPLTTRTT